MINDYLMTAALLGFLCVFICRTIILSRVGVKVFVIGSGKKGLERMLEILFFVFVPLWIAACAGMTKVKRNDDYHY